MTSSNSSQSTKPRILIIISNLEVGGGAQRVAATLGSELTGRGTETHLLTFYEYPQTYEYKGIYHSRKEQPKSWYKKPGGVIARIWGIRRVCKENDIDVAVSFLPEASFYTLASKILFLNRVKMVVSVRNNPNNRNRLYRFLIRLLYPLADRVVPNARATEEILQNEYGLTRTTTIYNPVDAAAIEQKAAESLPDEYRWITERSPLFVSIGRLTKQKGQWHLIRAFTEVVKEKPEAALIILGDGELRGKLEQLIRDCGLEENVFLLGVQENVFPFLKASDRFVFSSLWEGMPNTMLEALTIGLPIISTDCKTGPREIIAPELPVSGGVEYPYETECGVLVPVPASAFCWDAPSKVALSADEQMLADAMKKAVTESIACPDSYKNPFSIGGIIDQWLTQIEHVRR